MRFFSANDNEKINPYWKGAREQGETSAPADDTAASSCSCVEIWEMYGQKNGQDTVAHSGEADDYPRRRSALLLNALMCAVGGGKRGGAWVVSEAREGSEPNPIL